MQNTLPLLSIIILNYKNFELSIKCVNRVITSLINSEFLYEIFLIDNSPKDSAKILNQSLPSFVNIVNSDTNSGYAGGNNIGIKLSKGEFVLLLNNDAFPENGIINFGIDYLKTNQNVGVWAPQLIGVDGKLQLSCSKFHSIIGLMGEYLLNINLDAYYGWSKWTSPHEVDAVIGAFFLTRRNVIEQVGTFDEGYFFTVEDHDYCRRIKTIGYTIVYDPRVCAIHIGGASQKAIKWVSKKKLHENRIRYMRKHHGYIIGTFASIIINLGVTARRTLSNISNLISKLLV